MSKHNIKKIISLCTVGTILEWYDFSLFGSLAPILSELFFPNYDKTSGLLAIFTVFFTGFLARPIGALFFGYIGDKFGRKISILLTMLIMTLSTVGIGLLPTYESIGISASIALVTMRILQGLSASGEHTGAITYLSEFVAKQKYFLMSFIFCGVMLGTLLGSALGFFITFIFDKNTILSYGWRIPFLLSFILGICGFYLRASVAETPVFNRMKINNELNNNPILHLVLNDKVKIILIIGMFCLNVISFYSIFVYLPGKLIQYGNQNGATILAINTISILIMSISILITAFMCDKYGGLIFIKCGAIGFTVFTYPIFLLMDQGGFFSILCSQCLLGIFNALFLAPTPYIYTSLFENNVRYSGVSLGMNLSAGFFGGLSPIVMTFLSEFNNHVMFQSLYLIIAAIISLISIKLITMIYFQPKIKDLSLVL